MDSILVLVKECALLILNLCVCYFMFYSVQSFSIEVPPVFLHLAFIIIYFTFKALVFLFQSLAKGSDVCWTESLDVPSQISSTPIHCPQPGCFQPAAAFIPCSDMFLVRTCFSSHCVTWSQPLESDRFFEALLSHFSDFQELCLLLSSSKIAALLLCPLCFCSFCIQFCPLPCWNSKTS